MSKEHKVEIKKISREEFAKTIDEMVLRLHEINSTKGKDYSKEDDVFFNFTSQGDALGLSPLIVWQVYFEKHLSAIRTFCKDGKVSSEGIESRILDAIMYLILLYGMAKPAHKMRNGKMKDTHGTIRHYKNDLIHREDGPVVIWPDGDQEWFLNGLRNREDGPAILFGNVYQEWWLDGKQLTKEEWEKKRNA